ncbi:Na+/H+ antiporter subunit E [Ilumatobacter sp.]|uniref:Na+/H+ antiporter subunit E n=1 Tax=Ilumatobacter sp. TaxID=1967498 RepID=UPI003B53037C
MRRVLRIPAIMLWLTILWVALWGDVSWGNVLGGMAIAGAVVASARLDPASLRPTYFHPLWALAYVATVAWQLVQSNLRLAWEILTPTERTHTAIVAVEVRGGSDAVINLVANSITLTPGTITVDVRRRDAAAPGADHPEGAELEREPRDDGALEGDPPDVEALGGASIATLYVHSLFADDVEQVRRDVLSLAALAMRAFGSDADARRARDDAEHHEPDVVRGAP